MSETSKQATRGGRPAPGAVFLPDLCGFTALFVVVVVAELVALIIVIAGGGFGIDFVDELALLSLYTQWLGLSAAGALCLARRGLNGLDERAIVVLSLLIALSTTYAVAELAWWVINPLVGAGELIRISRGDFVGRTVVIGGVVAALVLRYFYVQFHYRQRIASEASARLQALQARIRPHFFFNCMNTIASLTRSDPVLAERAVEDLADLFRASLSDAVTPVSAAEEIAFVERYLNIERLRLGERLVVSWQVEDLPSSARLPLLSLQPIVENAIYHGIEPARAGGTIAIAAAVDGDRLVVDITNPAGADGHARHHGNRIALDNVRERLRALYGARASLAAGQVGEHYRVRLEVPLEAGA
ncbi:MAG: histidine kinase [Gammaproteobacteria bacterium]|nr:histidine kinase [Gammaproteobacteria bacterium]MCP5199658.1 histidine kinase [Gammaproteobacteria bacterium]